MEGRKWREMEDEDRWELQSSHTTLGLCPIGNPKKMSFYIESKAFFYLITSKCGLLVGRALTHSTNSLTIEILSVFSSLSDLWSLVEFLLTWRVLMMTWHFFFTLELSCGLVYIITLVGRAYLPRRDILNDIFNLCSKTFLKKSKN